MVEDYSARSRAAAELTFINKGVPKEVLSKLLNPTTSRDQIRRFAKEFNSTHQDPQGIKTKIIIDLPSGRTISLYYDKQGGVMLGYGFGGEPQEKDGGEHKAQADLKLIEIPDLGPDKITKITTQQLKSLISKFQNLNFMLVHLDKYADSAEGQRELFALVNHTLENLQELRKNTTGKDDSFFEGFKDRFMRYLPKYLRFARERMVRYLLPAKKYLDQKPGGDMPASFQTLLRAYLELIQEQ